jgi:hypothetical protein
MDFDLPVLFDGQDNDMNDSFDDESEYTFINSTTIPIIPNISDQSVVIIMVMSARPSFDKRQVIRETWASGWDNVFFVVGESCPYAPEQRSHPLKCVSDEEETLAHHTNEVERVDLALQQEQEQYQDILIVDTHESYHSLPFKLKAAYTFVIQRLPKIQWILKADDDFFVRIHELTEFLQQHNPTQPTVIGRIMPRDPVRRTGKWAELNYKHRFYPEFPLGSVGHVVSRPVADYVAKHKNKLFEYQGEDTSLGIWLHESSLKVKFVSTSTMANNGMCLHPHFYVTGHGIDEEKMRRCFERFASRRRDRQQNHPQTQEPIILQNVGRPEPKSMLAPHLTNDTMVVMVMSARGHFLQRKVIRSTWAKGHNNVYFVIGAACPYQLRHEEKKCDRLDDISKDSEYYDEQRRQQAQLIREQNEHRDILYINRYESYHALVAKLKESYHYVIQNMPTVQWIVKADDDIFVRVDSLARYLASVSPTNPTVVGRIIYGSPVQKSGKWREDPKYKRLQYPPWAQGSCGHVVSRPVAEFISHNKNSLYDYQGEDTSMAIWLDESPLQKTVLWYNSGAFVNEGDCLNPDFLMVGHQIGPRKMKECYESLDEIENLPPHNDDYSEEA